VNSKSGGDDIETCVKMNVFIVYTMFTCNLLEMKFEGAGPIGIDDIVLLLIIYILHTILYEHCLIPSN